MLAETISQFLSASGVPTELIIVIIAALPVIELRGAIPFGINLMGMEWYVVFPLALLGNLLPVPFILYLLDAVTRLLSRIALFDRFFTWLFSRTRKRSQVIEEYERIGLVLFVSVPLPVTGAWTGSLAAVLLGMDRRWAIVSVFTGVFIAGVIVTVLSLLGWVGAVIAGLALVSFAVFSFWRSSG